MSSLQSHYFQIKGCSAVGVQDKTMDITGCEPGEFPMYLLVLFFLVYMCSITNSLHGLFACMILSEIIVHNYGIVVITLA